MKRPGGEPPQGSGEAITARGLGRQAKAQQPIVPVEAPHPDPCRGEGLVDPAGFGMAHEAVEISSTGWRETGYRQNGIEGTRLFPQPDPHGRGPALVAERHGADGEGRPCNGPWPEGRGDRFGDDRRGHRKAEPNPGKAEEFAEGAEHHDRGLAAKAGCRRLGPEVEEGFIDDQPATTRAGNPRRRGKMVGIAPAPIGIVRVHDHHMADIVGKRREVTDHLHGGADPLPRQRMFAIGRPDHRDIPGRRQHRQPLDQRLRARSSDEADALGHAIGAARSISEPAERPLVGERGPGLGRQVRQREGMRIDAGRQVQPVAARAPVEGHGRGEVAAVLHGPSLPWRRRLGQSLAGIAALLALATTAMAGPPARIASINMCTDQLLVDLARPDQIVGLSPFAHDGWRSWAAARARAFPALSGTAEEIIVLKPDLVLAGRFTRQATRAFIRERGIAMEEFDVVRTVADARRQILRVAAIVGAEAAGEARAAALDTAMERLRAAAKGQPLRILPLARRGWVAGQDSVITDLLRTAGLINVAGEAGLRGGGFLSVEEIVMLRPDAILISRDADRAEDQGQAMLVHPAIADRFPAERRIVLPEALTVCGGPMLVEAIDRLAAQIAALTPRRASAP